MPDMPKPPPADKSWIEMECRLEGGRLTTWKVVKLKTWCRWLHGWHPHRSGGWWRATCNTCRDVDLPTPPPQYVELRQGPPRG